VLDVIHRIQATDAPDLACRWNCKAANAARAPPRSTESPAHVHDRMDQLPRTVTVAPMRAFPIIRDCHRRQLQLRDAKKVPASTPRPHPRRYRMQQIDIEPARSSASALSASCARTSATSSVTTRRTSRTTPATFLHPLRRTRDAPARHQRPPELAKELASDVQHHEVLHGGVPRAHQDHRQRHHPMKERVVDAQYDRGLAWRKILRRHKLTAKRLPTGLVGLPMRCSSSRPSGSRPITKHSLRPARAGDVPSILADGQVQRAQTCGTLHDAGLITTVLWVEENRHT